MVRISNHEDGQNNLNQDLYEEEDENFADGKEENGVKENDEISEHGSESSYSNYFDDTQSNF